MHERCHASMDADQVRSFKCIECPNESKMWRDCTTHMWKQHQIDIDLIKCPFCSFKDVFSGKFYNRYSNLERLTFMDHGANNKKISFHLNFQSKYIVTYKFIPSSKAIYAHRVQNRSINLINCVSTWLQRISIKMHRPVGIQRKPVIFVRTNLPHRKHYRSTSKPYTIELDRLSVMFVIISRRGNPRGR